MNSSHEGVPARYTQVKVWIPPELASAFKAKCLECHVSMASEISSFMRERIEQPQPKKPTTDPYATRPLRRKSMGRVINQLSDIMDAEQRYLDNIPENLQGSRFYDAAQLTISALEEALDLLSEAY